ncbi:serine hydrolase [Thalassomonas actiniarum]|uniref:Serine hydrolase n=1 Tax=Thalassomonas actiniarum TaxID=485447 RepID=A0AAE9YWF3_9GAMM|nr:serine hydrolase [Thalassomonas actiniarum]WDE02436.1 serine hydrolase [Thalassomonas actiniarum]
MLLSHKAILLSVCVFLFSCDDSSSNNTMQITGVVLDNSAPAQAIANARVQLIGTELQAFTDAQGSFSIEITEDIDREHLAVSVSVEHYRPRESNVSLQSTTTIGLSPAHSYHYHRPVQLTDDIQTGDLNSAGLDNTLINQLMNKTVLADTSAGYQELHSLLIYKDGVLAVEEYFPGNNDFIDFSNNIARISTPAPVQWGRTDKHYIASVNKALTATVAGIAFEQFNVSTSDAVAPHLPQQSHFFNDDANKSALNFHHLLTMQLGFSWDEWGSNDLALMWQSTDFTDFLLSRDNLGPQSAWVYNSASPNMLLKALDNLVQTPIRDWADAQFYRKLGITDYDWRSQPGGLPEGAARMHMRPRDMLKIGITYLNNGVWQGQQVIPAQWVEEVAKVQVAGFAGDYSYFFWHRELNGVRYLSADGDGGQYINIFPEQNMVIVMTQGNYLEWPLYVNQADDIMANYIIPAAY